MGMTRRDFVKSSAEIRFEEISLLANDSKMLLSITSGDFTCLISPIYLTIHCLLSA